MHFEARQGAASLIPFGKCEEGGGLTFFWFALSLWKAGIWK